MKETVIRNDEPSLEDHLGREHYTKALAQMASNCATPLVIGLYGRWGIGKTSLMKQIEAELRAGNVKTVWFDPWQHQFDESPALALLHTAIKDLDANTREELMTTLLSLSAALGSVALKLLTSVDATHIKKVVNDIEEEKFALRERQVELREYFATIINAVRGINNKRIVFFIDDLDRCMPRHILKLFESIKLYLNLDGCVYLLGMDRRPIEQGIRHEYNMLTDFTEAEYLDKIIQLPFTIPPIASESVTTFVDSLLPKVLEPCQEIVLSGLANNPRQIKRFINTLMLNHLLAVEAKIEQYDPKILSFILLIQLRHPLLYGQISIDTSILIRLKSNSDKNQALRQEYLTGYPEIESILNSIILPRSDVLESYIYLTEVAYIDEAGAERGEFERLLLQPITQENLSKYESMKYPELSINFDVQRLLLHDIDKSRFQILRELDNAVEEARDAVDWYRSRSPEVFLSSTDYLTKSLGFYDEGFRERHRFGKATRAVFADYEKGLR